MSQFTDDDRIELAKFLRSAAGIHFLAHLREVRAKMPPHFTPADGNMQPHHISLHYAFGVAEAAKIEQIILMMEVKSKLQEAEPVALFDGKQLSR